MENIGTGVGLGARAVNPYVDIYMNWMVKDGYGDRQMIRDAVFTLGEDFLRDVGSYRDFSDSVRAAMATAAEEKARTEREAQLKAEDEKRSMDDERRKQEKIEEEREKEKGKKQKKLTRKEQAESDTSHSNINDNTKNQNQNQIQSSGERKRRLNAVDQEIISVTLYFPALREQPMIVNVGENTTWREFFDLCLCVAGADDSQRDNMTLTHIAHPSWPGNAISLRMTAKIDDTLLFSKSLIFPYLSRTEREKNIFELRHMSLSNIGGCFSLSMLAESEGRFNPFMQKKVQELEKKHSFGAYREIRGDGNCYFRAVLYGALERVIESPRRAVLLREWYKLFQGIVFPKQTAKDVLQRHDQLLSALREAIEGRLWPTAQHLEKDFIHSDSQIDLAFICACKHAVRSFILTNRSTEFNGISLEDSIKAFLTDDQSLEQYCEREVLAMGECAEGAHVYLGVLPALFGFRCEIAMLYADATPTFVQKCAELFITNEQSKRERESKIDFRESLPVISLLFRPGHYDLLYRSTQPSVREEKIEQPSETVTGLGNDYEEEKEKPQVERDNKKQYAFSSRSSLIEARDEETRLPVDERSNENRLKLKQASEKNTRNVNDGRLDLSKQASVIDYSQSAQVSLSAPDPASAAHLSPASLRSPSPASTRRNGVGQFSGTGSISDFSARKSLSALAQTQSWGDIASNTDVDNKSNNNTSSNYSRIAPSTEFASPRISHPAVVVIDDREERSRSRVKERPSISSPIPRKEEEPTTLLFVKASTDKAEEKMTPMVNEALSESQLQEIHHRFFDPLEVDNYLFLVREMEFPSPLVLDAMITYGNRCLITIMVVVKLLRDREDFSPSKHTAFTATPVKNASVKSLCRQCRQMGIAVDDIIFALSEDDVLTVEDLIDSIEVRDRRAKQSQQKQHQQPLHGSRDFLLESEIDRRVSAKKYGNYFPLSSPFVLSDEEVREEVGMMGRNRIIDLLKKCFLYNSRYDCLLKTKDLREKLMFNMKFRSY